MTGRERCNRLKGIRKGLADALGVNLDQRECTFEGECKGTCPRCKHEEDLLNRAILRKGAAVAGAAIVATSLAACTPDVLSPIVPLGGGDDPTPIDGGGLAGDVAPDDTWDDGGDDAGNDAGNDAGTDSVPIDGGELAGDVAPDDTWDDGNDFDTEGGDDVEELSGEVAPPSKSLWGDE
jgi:hypothetical protein